MEGSQSSGCNEQRVNSTRGLMAMIAMAPGKDDGIVDGIVWFSFARVETGFGFASSCSE